MGYDHKQYQKDYHRRWREENKERLRRYRKAYNARLPLEKKAELAQKKARKRNGKE